MATYKEVYEKTLEYFKGDELAASVFVGKYALTDNQGDIKEMTPDDMHRRLAREFARIEKKYPNPLSEEEIYNLLKDFKYVVAQGSPMNAVGNDYQIQSVGNCYVLDNVLDSYSGIMKSDQELVQLMKRRCVAKDSKVFIRGKGVINIQDVKVGDYILSLDGKKASFEKVTDFFSSKVEKEKQIKITLSNGTILRTSKDHPVLKYDESGYSWPNAGELKPGNVLIRNVQSFQESWDEKLSDLAWLIGHHIGDGTADERHFKTVNKKSKKKNLTNNNRYRVRCLGDNETCISEYTRVMNDFLDSKVKHGLSNRKSYKSPVWCVAFVNKKLKTFFDDYLDGQIGKKTYTCKTPKFIKENNLFLPFLSGLIDADGSVNENGSIDLSMTSKEIMDEVASYLAFNGLNFSFHVKSDVRKNERELYRIKIHNSNFEFIDSLLKLMKHDGKLRRLKESARINTRRYFLTEEEKKDVYSKYKKLGWGESNNLLSANICHMLTHDGIGISSLNTLFEKGLITEGFKDEVRSRVYVKTIEPDDNEDYYDLSVDKTNNFFTGNFGSVCVHNCGVGLDISKLRPKGTTTRNAAKTSDGIAVFMERFSNTCREVAQGGRRGALMISISVHHPEIETFINIKKDKKKVTGANISIRLSKEFMEAVRNDGEYTQQWPVDVPDPKIVRKVHARKIWEQIIRAAWESAEPGLMFWDHANDYSPSHIYKDVDPAFENKTSNPCGEIIMGTDSCRLLVLNLLSFVSDNFKEDAKFDYVLFKETAVKAQRLMDDIIDIEVEKIDKILAKIEVDPEPSHIKTAEITMWKEFRRVCIAGRRTGLGITALGDTLAALNVRYGSDESVKITEEIYKTLAVGAYTSSIQMAKERGSFPLWDYNIEKDHVFIKRILGEITAESLADYKKFGRRNVALTTTAPTGSVSMLTQTTSGIEPAFLLKYTRRKKINPDSKDAKVDFVDELGDKWQEFTVYHHNFKKWMEVTGKTEVEDSPYYKATSNDVDWGKSVEIQAVAQKWLCHAVSKTCNLPNEATEELVNQVYMRAWEAGCKGFTVYRDGCRSGVLVSESTTKPDDFIQTKAPKRSDKMPCDIHRVTISGEAWTILVGLYKDSPYEIFGGLSKYVHIPKKFKAGHIIKTNKKRANGGGIYELHYGEDSEDMNIIRDIVDVFDNPTHGAFTRTISLGLRHGVPVQFMVEQLQKDEKDSDMYSFSRVIARVFKKYIKDGTKSTDKVCDNCGAEGSVIYKEGCKTCASCGYSKC